MTPLENRSLGRSLRTPGPGEPGFRCVEQKNIDPQSEKKARREAKKSPERRAGKTVK
jgi:hypothetical protein